MPCLPNPRAVTTLALRPGPSRASSGWHPKRRPHIPDAPRPVTSVWYHVFAPHAPNVLRPRSPCKRDAEVRHQTASLRTMLGKLLCGGIGLPMRTNHIVRHMAGATPRPTQFLEPKPIRGMRLETPEIQMPAAWIRKLRLSSFQRHAATRHRIYMLVQGCRPHIAACGALCIAGVAVVGSMLNQYNHVRGATSEESRDHRTSNETHSLFAFPHRQAPCNKSRCIGRDGS